MNIKKGDKVLITKGKDRSKSGKVIKIFVESNKVVIDGLNLVKKTVKPKKQGEKGQIIAVPSPLAVSNVKLICQSCGEPTKVGHRTINQKKERYCKKCKATN
ncbi:MAG: 50S ribosomal protein L24 [Candidatus Colwellbacteria bacterium RIFCSPHIGHO2_12_FULL_43_12]|uniref:Large ribosomal subunit protein uL24 n=2 Tax=Candidatus Colwelliibacteriota TaxID=1817904 RepID=A0A1G1Z127_9BACT|nr:MAG: 50S ribosomal protein L24 [Candidatus Colwellbacteria bacterium RIFCSPHIGHO2_12_FULL_43_12]OGY60714.1 MAG: 50S ribosomal protein L24 [Candidatus Colwellbacteria bacterium RIFCSPLOWO2_12_FULL_43_11]